MKTDEMVASYDFTNPVFKGALKEIPKYILALASKRNGVRCHFNREGLAKKQVNYRMTEAQ